MKALPAIARYMRLPEEQLRFPVELIQQGYEPNYLATYRPDELGGIDVETLARMKRALVYEGRLAEHKAKVLEALGRDQTLSDSVQQVLDECTSISQVDAIARGLRGKKSAKTFADANPQVEVLGQAILMAQGQPPQDLAAWVSQQAGVSPEDALPLLEATKQWLKLLLCEDAKLLLQLQRAILKNANVSLTILPEPAKGEEAKGEDVRGEDSIAERPIEIEADTAKALASGSVSDSASVAVPEVPSSDTEDPPLEPIAEEAPASETNEIPVPISDSDSAAPVAPLLEQFHQGRKQAKAIKTRSLSDKQLSPRQRRRRWLRGILESYGKLRKPLRALTPYQVLMLSRGIRSRIVDLNFQQDLRPLVQACRDTLCPTRHPMHGLLMEIAESGVKELLLPRLHQDVISILEEDANQELIEAAVLHLQHSLLQRPVRGHRILCVDAVGLKTAAVAVVDADGNVLKTGEIPCNSSKPDVVSQNMALLGQWVHEHHVTLIALSNGPSRRYLIFAIAELLKQSSEGSLHWTLVDRAGSDAYCSTRTSLIELPRISKRHRAAVWLAWRLQDPLKQILKVDPARLRLGSYQRELPQAELESALQESVSATISKAGVDVFSADVDVLKRVPGMNEAAAQLVAAERERGTIVDRDSLMQVLRQVLTEMQARQAIGFLRVFGSPTSLDGTIIHPEDYRLAERLIANADMPIPPAAPAGWTKPDYEKIAAARAAVAGLAVENSLADSISESANGAQATSPSVNPNFGVIEESTESTAALSVAPVAETNVEPSEPTSTLAEAAATDSPSIEVSKETETPETAQPTQTDAESLSDEAVGSGSAPADEDAAESDSVAGAPTLAPTHGAAAVDIPTGPMSRPTLSVDAEKLARSWSVGRAKLLMVAQCLQFPLDDDRDFQFPVPLRSQVPRLDGLPPGTMLQAMVIGIAEFGVFVELGPDCSGLIHISRLASDFVEDPHQFVQVGDVIPVWVVSVDEKRKRVSLTAIPPGTPERRRDSASSNETAPQRQERQPARGQERVSATNRAGDSRGQGTAAGARGQDRGRDRRDGGRPGDRSGGRSYSGRGNRGRRDDDRSDESSTRRPVRIDKPQPQTPITEAMQQGKEPLRSFSDLMQYMKQSKTPESPVSEAVAAVEVASEPQVVESPVVNESVSPGDDRALESDANSPA